MSEQSNTVLNIFQRMSLATADIGYVAKNLNVPAGGKTYKAVSEADVLDAVKAAEAKYGIYSYPVTRIPIESSVMTSKSEYQGKTSEKSNLFLRLETVYRFVNIDNPADYMETTSYGDGVDSQDKSPGKAMTYADKYALMKAYKVSTGDDPDAEGSGELTGYQKKPTPPTPPPAPPKPAAPTTPAVPAEIMCPVCDHPVVKTEYGGKKFTADTIFRKYGMCWDCYQKNVRAEAGARGQ